MRCPDNGLTSKLPNKTSYRIAAIAALCSRDASGCSLVFRRESVDSNVMRKEEDAVSIPERTLMAMHRLWYMVAIYSGIRAFANRVLSAFRHRGVQIAPLHGTLVSSKKLGNVAIFVHSRGRPPSGASEVTYGMISIRQERPRISRLLYQYFCLTSHFGLGHMEVAFYEQGRRITYYGVRNIARSNARRLGFTRLADKLRLTKRDEELLVISEVSLLLETHGFVAQFARSDECVSLSVCGSLLHPATQMRALDAIKSKYDRLHRKLRQRAHNKASILTPDSPRVESFMTIQPSTQKSERALGQA
jgi:hypothetical protein